MTRFIGPTGHGRRRRLIEAFVLIAALVIAATVVGLGRAGSVRTGVTIEVLPHTLTLDTSGTAHGLLATDFTNAGPSTVNHVFETVTTDAPPGTVFTPASTDCAPSGSGFTCNIGQVAPGTVTRLVSFTTGPATSIPFTLHVSVSTTFDEGKGSGLTDTVSDTDTGTFVAASDNAHKGQCVAGQGGSLTTSDGTQQTFLNYPGLPVSFVPCTPGAAGVNPAPNGTSLTGDISFVEFLNGNGLATVQITIFDPPTGVKKSNLSFIEYANYPDTTPTNGGNPVPKCQFDSDGNPVIPAGSSYVSCVVSITNNPGGGLLATLAVQGGSDPGWGTG